MNLDLDTAAAEWIEAKAAERAAVERRRSLEDHIASLLGVPESLEGTETTETDGGHKIKLVGRMNRKVDRHAAEDIAAEYSLEAQLDQLFRWKPEVNVSAWKAAPDSVRRPFLKSITTTPSRVSFIIEKD
jgi:plasmid stabilization system protein ParE